MHHYRTLLVGGLGISCMTLAACDLVAGIGTYCEVGVDPGCGTGGTAGNGGTTAGGGGTGGGGAGGATGMVCVPDEMQGCYSGPAGTKNIGNCKAGQALCNGEGT